MIFIRDNILVRLLKNHVLPDDIKSLFFLAEF